MAKQNKGTKQKLEKTRGGKFGKYKEDHGGGTVVDGGGRGEWTRRGRPGHRVSQPRTDDGKFTYNSANGKGLSTEKSRGKTVNPILTGGVNGIYIDDVKKQFENQSGEYWEKYKNKWYRKGDKIILAGDTRTRVSGEDIWEVAKKYNKKLGEFQVGGSRMKESEVFDKVKSGVKTKGEVLAANKMKKTGKEQFVLNPGKKGISSVKKWQKQQQTGTTPTQAPTSTTTAPTQGQVGSGAAPVTQSNSSSAQSVMNADYTPKYSDDDILQAVDVLKQMGFSNDEINDFNALSPKEKDQFIDDNLI